MPGGWDKVIRVWTRNDKGEFEPSRTSYRIPVGPGLGGSINALALSPDGEWLAAAGNGMARQIAGFRNLGFIVPASGVQTPLMLRDVGTIYLFNTRVSQRPCPARTSGVRHGSDVWPAAREGHPPVAVRCGRRAGGECAGDAADGSPVGRGQGRKRGRLVRLAQQVATHQSARHRSLAGR